VTLCRYKNDIHQIRITVNVMTQILLPQSMVVPRAQWHFVFFVAMHMEYLRKLELYAICLWRG